MTPGGGIWIQGAGEMASAAALCLARAGYRVIMAEIDRPLAVRRLVCHAEAVYTGRSQVEESEGRLVACGDATFGGGVVLVVIDPLASALPRVGPAAVIDARMTKRAPAPLPRDGIPLIGLGPGYTCGQNADLVIETHREAGPGRVIDVGCAAPDPAYRAKWVATTGSACCARRPRVA